MVNTDGTSEGAPQSADAGVRPGRLRRRVVTVAIVWEWRPVRPWGPRPWRGATSPSTTQPGSTTSTTVPGRHNGAGVHFGGRFGGPGIRWCFGAGVGGPVVHGQYTVKGPNGYETIDERTGTVSDVTNTSGSTWSLKVKSGRRDVGDVHGELVDECQRRGSGIASVKTDDTVSVTPRCRRHIDGHADHRPDDTAGQREVVVAGTSAAAVGRTGWTHGAEPRKQRHQHDVAYSNFRVFYANF